MESGVSSVFRYNYGAHITPQLPLASRNNRVSQAPFSPICNFSLAQVHGTALNVRLRLPGPTCRHSSDQLILVPEVFCTFNASTATPAEVTLSGTFQTAIANFIKDPTMSPAENWPSYVPVGNVSSVADIAFNGNVAPDNFAQKVPSGSLVGGVPPMSGRLWVFTYFVNQDGPCTFWSSFLDFRP